MRIEALLAEQGAVLDNVVFGIVQERDLRIVSTNRRFDELFGYAEGELVGEPIAVLFPDAEDLRARHRRQRAGPGQRQGDSATSTRTAAATAACSCAR
jgi:PAS domain S-box-containing protein